MTLLSGRQIAVPESRELQTMSLLLRNRHLPVLEVPLVAIVDVRDTSLVHAWLQRFIANPPDLLILLTGEGVRRLVAQAEAVGCKEAFVSTMSQVSTLCRGPKPGKALRELGLQPTYEAETPTSAGVLALAQTLGLASKRIAVQLYGQEENHLLINGLRDIPSVIDKVSPYVYAEKVDEDRVVEFIEAMQVGKIAMVAFTSQSQYKRLLEVAHKRDKVQALRLGLSSVVLAAVGPVVKQQLESDGYEVPVMPERSYFMKPLVAAMLRYVEQNFAN